MARKKTEEGKNYVWVEMTTQPSKHITKEEEKTILAQAQKKYGGQAGKLRFTTKKYGLDFNDSGDDSLNAENIQNIQDPAYHQYLFKKYIEENGIKDYNWDEILNIDSRVNSMINYDNYEKGRRFELNYAKWKNFLSYGDDNYFDFSKLHGLVLLRGEPANKSGKSTFAYDLIHFALFGKTRSGKADTKAEMFNNYLPNEREVVVELGLTINGERYIIKRTLTKPDPKKKTKNITNTVEYYRINESGSSEKLQDVDNLQGTTATKTTKAIKEAIGSEEDFDRIISANAKDLDELISMKDTDRGRVLARWIGLLPIEDKEARAKEMWARESVGRLCDSLNRETLKDEISEIKEAIIECKKTIEANAEKIETNKELREKDQKHKDTLLSSKQNIDDTLLKVDVTTIEKRKDDITELGKKKAAERGKLENEVKNYGDVEYSEEEYKAYQKERTELSSERGSLRAQLNSIKDLIKSLQSSEYCPVCGKKFDNVDNSQAIAENKAKIDEGIKVGLAYKKRCDELDELIAGIDEKRSLYIEKNQKEIKIQALNTEINTLRGEYKELKKLGEDYQKNKDAIIKNNQIDADVTVLETNIKTYDEIIRHLENENVALSKDIETSGNTITEKEQSIKTIEKEIEAEKNWKLYLQMVGKDGISKMVLKSTVPIINENLDNLLCDVADFNVEVEVNYKNDIEFWLIRDDVKTRLSAGSGLEKTMASLALRVVLGKMSNLSKPPFIVLDEILGSVAKENYEDMRKLYEKISQDYVYILHICHIDLDWHTQTILCRKENNISTITME